jgi:hypothetical protein
MHLARWRAGPHRLVLKQRGVHGNLADTLCAVQEQPLRAGGIAFRQG